VAGIPARRAGIRGRCGAPGLPQMRERNWNGSIAVRRHAAHAADLGYLCTLRGAVQESPDCLSACR